MKHFIHLFFHDHRWFMGTIACLIFGFFFWWAWYDAEGLMVTTDNFLAAGKNVLICIISVVIAVGIVIFCLERAITFLKGKTH